ncbi:hypothetical protein EJ02DRAFT_3302 [Clathrospora elynae]|uniref:Uncharacterized protein n=1 Tax=Clathrospora elynae TaxID=706981 RepID=A0A6A5T6B3_9PLEO|nr:hypothetical protein EJ02DRAFT_3302 [Clathrospora elynae]
MWHFHLYIGMAMPRPGQTPHRFVDICQTQCLHSRHRPRVQGLIPHAIAQPCSLCCLASAHIVAPWSTAGGVEE